MPRFVSLLIVALMPLLFTSGVSAERFTDVVYDPWEGGVYVDKLQSEGLIEGFPDNTFRGNQVFTRYEMAVVMSRFVTRLLSEISHVEPDVADALESPASGGIETSFVDVPSGHWAGEEVKNLESLGLLIGHPGGRFDGNRGLTHSELAVILSRLLHRLPSWFSRSRYTSSAGETVQPFSDVPEGHWAYEDVTFLHQIGIIEGHPDGTFGGNRTFIRHDMAMVIARIWDRLASELREEQERTESL
jgi:hypothetical protein